MARSKLYAILEAGVKAGASDWHVREGCTVILRVDSQLVEITDTEPDKEFLLAAVHEICGPEKLAQFNDIGDADFSFQEEGIGRFRINLHKQRGLIAMSIRHVQDKVPPIDELGLPPMVHNIANETRGIILVTGTTGSGKSTTLACMLDYMNETSSRHIITIENPIEYTFEDKSCIFEQREVGLDTVSFASALKHMLRQDPDVIVVGEMRDRESFDAALQAADTGHLVMSTLHTISAAQSIHRIMDFYPDAERKQVRMALASSLKAIICQRLVPRAFGKGRIPAIEIMVNNATIKKLLEDDKIDRMSAAIEGMRGDGMQSFNQALYELVNEGQVTEENALEAASNPEALQMMFEGIFLNTAGAILGE